MVNYDLSHLTQADSQLPTGPIQDDEAIFLYSIVRGSRLTRILEIGGLNGYSAKNFLQATSHSNDATVYTCDINPVPSLAPNHKIITKNAIYITPEDLDNKPLDMVFFDCHDYIQLGIYSSLVKLKLITDKTILALHDTCLHYPKEFQGNPAMEHTGYIHQQVECHMVNLFKEMGYDIFSIVTDITKHSPEFPYRCGVTVCQKFKPL
jgi:predicted O-methyltransferase YrrM